MTNEVFSPGLVVAIVTDRSGRSLADTLSAVRTGNDREFLAVEDLPSALKTLGLPEDAEIEL